VTMPSRAQQVGLFLVLTALALYVFAGIIWR
jgi:hypothetical protein